MPIDIHANETLFFFSSPFRLLLALGAFLSATLFVALCAKHARQRHSKDPNLDIIHKAKKPRAHELDEECVGVWQKAIMMGQRCEPPEFSGVIYYDYRGNMIPEMPKSPMLATSLNRDLV